MVVTPQRAPMELAELAKRLQRMDSAIRPVVDLGRTNGTPGTVGAAPLARLLHAAIQQLPDPSAEWCFADLGAGAGRMLLAAALCGACRGVGIEVDDLRNTFQSCYQRLSKQGLAAELQPANFSLLVGDALTVRAVSEMVKQPSVISPDMLTLQPPSAVAAADTAPPAKRPRTRSSSSSSSSRNSGTSSTKGSRPGATSTAQASSSSAAPKQLLVSMIDEGIPDNVREHMYTTVSQDPAVDVIITVNFVSRASKLHAILQQRQQFQLVAEMPAPLTGGHCCPTGRVYRRSRG